MRGLCCACRNGTLSGSLKASVSPFTPDDMNTRAILTHQQERKEQLFGPCLCLPRSLSAVPVPAVLRTPDYSSFKSQCPLLPTSNRMGFCKIYFLAHQPSNIKHYYARRLLINTFLHCFSITLASFMSLPRGLTHRLNSPRTSTPPSLGLPLLTDSSSTRPLRAHLSYSTSQPPLARRCSALRNYSLEYFRCF